MKRKSNFFIMVFVVCLVSFSSAHFVNADDGSVFENFFKNLLSGIFPMSEPQLAPLAVGDCASGLPLGQCDIDGVCDVGFTSADEDPLNSCPSGVCCRPLGVCGDGLVDATSGETCDGTNLNGQTCISQGFDVGTLTCSSCSLNTSGCMYEFVMKGDNYLNDTYAAYDGAGGDQLHYGEAILQVQSLQSLVQPGLYVPSSTVVIKWYFPSLPGAIVKEAIMNLTLVTASGDNIYYTSVHALGGNPVINEVSGYNASSVAKWALVPTGTTLGDVPMGLANIGPAVDYVFVDSNLFTIKQYNITKLVQDWNNGVYSNRGLLIRGHDSDSPVLRQFASKELESINPSTPGPTLRLRYIQCADGDGDGYNVTGGECGVVDCDDTNISIWNLYDLYLDRDNDLYGQTSSGIVDYLCGNDTLPSDLYLNSINRSLVSGDCNDANSLINPNESEVCDNVDQDCDLTPDDGLVCECYTSLDCDDVNTCTTNNCDQVVGIGSSCSYDPVLDSTPCDDGLFCTTTDQCNLGICGGTSINIDDGISCTIDSCDDDLNVIINTPTDSLCDNNLACDGVETCDALSDCQAGIPLVVDDGLYCTSDSCDEINGVLHIPLDCSANNIPGITTCSNIPDGIDSTRDFRLEFISSCSEITDSCSTGSSTITHTCNVSCGAECDANTPCAPTDCDIQDRCVGNDYYNYIDVNNFCLADCSCGLNLCGSPIITTNSPLCIVSPTCSDGIQNGDETGVDCGGSCPNSCDILCIDNLDPLTCNADLACEWCYDCENNNGPASLLSGTASCVDAGGCGSYVCDAGVICAVQAQCDAGDITTLLSCVDSATQLNETLNCNATCVDEVVNSQTSSCGVGEICREGFGCVSDGLDYINYPVNNAGWKPFAIPLVNLTNNDSSVLNADVLLTYDSNLGWLMNYKTIKQIDELEPAKGYLAYYSSPTTINLIGNLDNTYRYSIDPTSWNLIGVMDSGYTITSVYGDPTFTAYGWDVNSNLVDFTANPLQIGVAYWVYPGTPLYAPPSFNLLDAILRLFGFG